MCPTEGLYLDPKATSSQSKSRVAFGGIGPAESGGWTPASCNILSC